MANGTITDGKMYNYRWQKVQVQMAKSTITDGKKYKYRWQKVQVQMTKCTITDGKKYRLQISILPTRLQLVSPFIVNWPR